MRLKDADALIENIQWAETVEDAIKEILAAPIIEAEPVKRGKWITERCDCLIGRTYCSVCGHDAPFDGDEVWRSLWCPNCGAHMKEADFEDEGSWKWLP